MTIRRPSLVLVAALSLLALPACNAAGGGQFAARPSPTAKPVGVVTVAEARKILARWDSEEKKAELDRAADFTGAEAGLLAEITKATALLLRALGEPVETSHEAIVKPRFAIPAKGAADPPWFMADFTRKGAKYWGQLIFQQTSDGWRVVARSSTSTKSRIPAPARDGNGLATVLAPDAKTGLPASPRQIAQAHARMQATFGQDPQARRLFTADAKPRVNARTLKDQRQSLRKDLKWNLKVGAQPTQELFTLRAANGGALIWYGLKLKQVYSVTPGAGWIAFTDRPSAAVSHGKRFNKKAVMSEGAIHLAVVGRSGQVQVPTVYHASFSITGS
ncbi:hypothetical protein [Nonomuraea rosea]